MEYYFINSHDISKTIDESQTHCVLKKMERKPLVTKNINSCLGAGILEGEGESSIISMRVMEIFCIWIWW